MTVFVIGCGESGKDWHKHRPNVSIGCNDAIKHGSDTDYLVLINGLQGFRHEPERVALIKQSKAKILTNGDSWKSIFPSYERVRLTPFGKYLKKGYVYSSKSSPFVAASYAFNLGATDIVLFGVDLVNHHLFHKGNRLFDYEMRNFRSLARMMAQQGTQMWVSSEESALSEFLHVWSPPVSIVVACDKIRQEMFDLAETIRPHKTVTAEEQLKRMLE